MLVTQSQFAASPALSFTLIFRAMHNFSRMMPVSQSWECYSLSESIPCLLNFAFFCSLSDPPILNFGFKITIRLDGLLPSNVSSCTNKALTPPKNCCAQNLAWREGLCSSRFTALFSSPNISFGFSWREGTPASKAFMLL